MSELRKKVERVVELSHLIEKENKLHFELAVFMDYIATALENVLSQMKVKVMEVGGGEKDG